MAITERYITRTASGGDGSIGSPWTLVEWAANAVAGDRGNVQDDGTDYTLSANLTFANSGTATSPIITRGYKTVIGDGNQGRTNGTGPLITTHMPTVNCGAYQVLPGKNYLVFNSLLITDTTNAVFVFDLRGSDYSNIINCNVFSTLGYGIRIGVRCCAIDNDCDTPNASWYALYCDGIGGYVAMNRVSAGSAKGIGVYADSCVIANNLIYRCAHAGITIFGTAKNVTIINNTVVDNGKDGVESTIACDSLVIINNQITDNGYYGIDNNVGATNCPILLTNNRIIGNGSGAILGQGDWPDYGTITDTTYEDYTFNIDIRVITGDASGMRVGMYQPGFHVKNHVLPASPGDWISYSMTNNTTNSITAQCRFLNATAIDCTLDVRNAECIYAGGTISVITDIVTSWNKLESGGTITVTDMGGGVYRCVFYKTSAYGLSLRDFYNPCVADYTDPDTDDYTLRAGAAGISKGAWDKSDIGAYANRAIFGRRMRGRYHAV